jgi:predicted dehydrogenase
MHTGSGVTALSPLGARGFRAEIAAFLRAVRTGAPAPVSAQEALLALQVALAAAESIRSGVPVALLDESTKVPIALAGVAVQVNSDGSVR